MPTCERDLDMTVVFRLTKDIYIIVLGMPHIGQLFRLPVLESSVDISISERIMYTTTHTVPLKSLALLRPVSFVYEEKYPFPEY